VSVIEIYTAATPTLLFSSISTIQTCSIVKALKGPAVMQKRIWALLLWRRGAYNFAIQMTFKKVGGPALPDGSHP